MTIIVDEHGDGIKWEIGKEYPPKDNIALCRCGETKNKPYCDGVHASINFDGTETASRTSYLENAEITDGPTLKLTDVKKICASARFCNPEGGTWELIRLSDDPKARALAIQQTALCPSGRLVAWEKTTDKVIEPDLEPSLGLVEDPHKNAQGPIWVQGGIPVESADGDKYDIRNRVTLCRCGLSSNKPFCDASHLD